MKSPIVALQPLEPRALFSANHFSLDSLLQFSHPSSAFAVDSQGAYLTLTGASGDSQIQLHNLQIAPKLMDFTTYSYAGTFSEVLAIPVNGKTINAKVSGKATSAIELIHRTSMTVPAGTFSAVEAKSTLKLTGEIQYTANGKKFKHPLTITQNQTFWAAPGIGEIADQGGEGIVIETGAEPIESSIDTFSQLKSYTLT
jgi:hypothetical protein